MKRILILNGPNLNLLGNRECDIYGSTDFQSYFELLKDKYKDYAVLSYKQSNVEGELINMLHETIGKFDAVVLNAGGYTHTSVAIADAVSAIMQLNVDVVEVHISNVTSREEYRHTSYLTPKVKGLILGFGLESYRLAVDYFVNSL